MAALLAAAPGRRIELARFERAYSALFGGRLDPKGGTLLDLLRRCEAGRVCRLSERHVHALDRASAAAAAATASDGDTDSVGSDDTPRGVARRAERCRNGPACFFLRGGRTCMHAHTPAELAHARAGRPSDGWWTCTACDFLNRPANGACGGAAAGPGGHRLGCGAPRRDRFGPALWEALGAVALDAPAPCRHGAHCRRLALGTCQFGH